MKNCRDREETLWLDLYGELNSAERSEWERHLAGCTGCREEKNRSVRMMALIREAWPVPMPHPGGAERVRECLGHPSGLNHRYRASSAVYRGWGWRGFPSRIAVAVCILLVIAGAIAILPFAPAPPFGPRPDMTADLNETEAEVIQHLELLEEMEAIRELVQRVDRSSGDPPSVDSTIKQQRSDAGHGAVV